MMTVGIVVIRRSTGCRLQNRDLIEARGYKGDTGAYRLLVTVGRVE